MRKSGDEGGETFDESGRMRQPLDRFFSLFILIPPNLAVAFGVKSFNVGDFDLNHAPQPPEEMADLHPFTTLNKHLLNDLMLRDVNHVEFTRLGGSRRIG